ncbi:adenosylcobinamide amidohydrolase [Haloplanus sp. C73]|uniref:adenosylcobinamide amidohydrolase n=1 Tax=Haloplanus sp. C73 TaxID=3421641 RepID=UPI003EB85A59
MFETTVRDGVCRLARPNTRWLSTGHDGGECRAPAAYNCTVPTGWERTDLSTYVDDRLADAGFDAPGPTLLTGVDQRHARRARLGPVEAVATAGVTNPARLPVDHNPERRDGDGTLTSVAEADHAGTVNVVVGTTRSLAAGALPNLLTVAAEAKAATLLELVGVPGTTTDAVVAACDPTGDPAKFSGSATPVGAAARACVRDAVAASLRSRHPDGEYEASSGVVTDDRATVTAVASDD